MRQELTLEQQDQQMQDRLEMAQFFARRENETRLQFVAREGSVATNCLLADRLLTNLSNLYLNSDNNPTE
jgi:hypothetical protein